MCRYIAVGCLALVLGHAAATARGGSIYIENTSIASGSTGYLNIYVTGTSAEAFDTYQTYLTISGPSNLSFDLNQPYGYLTSPSYIFGPGDSGDAFIGGGGGTIISSSTMEISDFSLPGNEYAPATTSLPGGAGPPAGATLLASILLDASSAPAAYTVSVDESYSNFFTNNGVTVPYSEDATSNSYYTGTVMVTGAAVPEPASIVLAIIATALVAGFGQLRHTRRRG